MKYPFHKKVQVGILLFFVLGVVIWLGYLSATRAQNSSMSMSKGISKGKPWRPNDKNAKYVGANACAKCHKEETPNYHLTTMAKALEPAERGELLRANPRLTFRSGPYSYQITRQGNQSIYSVTDGKNTISVPILYAFGQGKAGQTYVFQYNGSYYESRLSYFKEIKGLDWTIGYPRDVPPSLEVAAGRAISLDEARNCFSCHSTAAATDTELRLERLIPGVSCEACHGPGGEHIAAMEAKNFKDSKIFNPGTMDADALTQEFCGSCHRSAEEIASNRGLQGLTSVRFQPYRLFTSRFHDPFDNRLSCISCHDPHDETPEDPKYYDAKCTNCHRSFESLKSVQLAKDEEQKGRTSKACPVSANSCVSCHMPKVEILGSHFKFTDHRIRISRPNEPFPH